MSESQYNLAQSRRAEQGLLCRRSWLCCYDETNVLRGFSNIESSIPLGQCSEMLTAL